MKRLFVVLLALVLTMNTVAVTALAEETAYTKIGYYSNEVLLLHRKLAELGYYSLRPESPWSEKSADALKILQENLGWEITGIVTDKGMYDEILSLEHVIGKNLLLGTNQGTKNYSIGQKGFETELTAPDGVEVKVTIISKADDAGWLTLFYNDGRSKEVLGTGEAGDKYTLSFDVKSNVESAYINISHKQSNAKENQIDFGQVNIGSEWQSVALTASTTGTAAADQGLYIDLRNNAAGTEILIRNLKLEKGSAATEWIAAAED